MQKGKLIVIAGPSGVGKGTIIKKLLATDSKLTLSTSATTRRRRAGEVDGREYYFLSRTEFEENIKAGKFAEYAEYAGNYYGTLCSTIDDALKLGKYLILEIEVKGAAQIREKYPDAKLIFIMPPNLAELKNRLANRNTENEEVIKLRLAQVDREIAKANDFDHKIVNDNLEIAILAVEEAIYS